MFLTDGWRSRNLGRWAGLSLFHCRVDDTAHKQDAAGRLVVNDEDKGPVDGESRRRDGEHAIATSCGDLIAALIHGHSRLKINLKTKQSKVSVETEVGKYTFKIKARNQTQLNKQQEVT